MLKIEVLNLKEVHELIGDMRDKVDGLSPIGGDSAISHELFNWQAEDMRRRYPEVEEPDPWTSVTHVYPRSRKSGQRHTVPRARMGARRRPLLRVRPQSPGAKRPLLRPALFEKLAERMQRLMEEKLTWR